MNHGSLFSGIGGFDLAAEWMEWENKFHCEWNEFGQKILKHYWPEATTYGNITKTDFTIWNGKIDILTGGFPCQPYSQAGQRRGKEDERHLWPEMLRAIKEIKPRWIVGENVYGIVNWNGGMVFEEVQAELENEGYTVQPYVLPACATGAPHRRDRVWFVAHSSSGGLEKTSKRPQKKYKVFRKASIKFNSCVGSQWDTSKRSDKKLFGSYGVSSELDGITISEHTRESIKGYGNAIVPQVALQIFKSIELYEQKISKKDL